MICQESAFHESLASFRLGKGPHCESDYPAASLMECIQRALPEMDVASVFDALLNNNSHSLVDFTCREIYRKGILYEYGVHKSLMEPNQQSTVGMLCALSKILSIDIYVVCGLMPLRMIRGGERAVKFSFAETSSPSSVVVGLIGINTFHNINQDEPESLSWSILNQNSVLFDMHELFEGAASVQTNEQNRMEQSNVPNENDLLSDEDEMESLQELNSAAPTVGRSSTTVREFIDKFYLNCSNSEYVENDESIYNFTRRIDFVASQIQDLRDNPIEFYRQIYDIDGFFGIYKWKHSKIFKGNAKIIPQPKMNCKREFNTFQNICKDVGIDSGNDAIFVKVADIVTNFGQFDYFFSVPIINNNVGSLPEQRLRELVTDSFQFALEAECIDPLTKDIIHPGCRFHRVRPNIDAHRSSSKARKRNQQFESKRFSCFCFHFHVHLLQKLFLEGFRTGEPYAYVQMVGTKSTLFASTLNDLVDSVSRINECFHLDKMKCFFDFSMSTIATLRDGSQKVFIHINYYIPHFLGVFVLEKTSFIFYQRFIGTS